MSVFTESLPVDSTSRLRAVAEMLRIDPERWYQGSWMTYNGEIVFDESPLDAILGFGPIDCDTNTACIAGWGLLLTPREQLRELPGVTSAEGWVSAASAALGLQPSRYVNGRGEIEGEQPTLADHLFAQDADADLNNNGLAKVLDALADIPENERTWEEFEYRWPSLAEALEH